MSVPQASTLNRHLLSYVLRLLPHTGSTSSGQSSGDWQTHWVEPSACSSHFVLLVHATNLHGSGKKCPDCICHKVTWFAHKVKVTVENYLSARLTIYFSRQTIQKSLHRRLLPISLAASGMMNTDFRFLRLSHFLSRKPLPAAILRKGGHNFRSYLSITRVCHKGAAA